MRDFAELFLGVVRQAGVFQNAFERRRKPVQRGLLYFDQILQGEQTPILEFE